MRTTSDHEHGLLRERRPARRIYLALLGLLLFGVASCSHNKRAASTVARRASVDFGCPEHQLTLTVLDTQGARGLASQIGAEGCGEKGVYIYLASTDTWISSTQVTPEMQRAEAEHEAQREAEDDAALQAPSIDADSNYQRGVPE